MASNSLFSTVTPCQQNFFWGKYCFAGCCCVWSWVRGSGSYGGLGVRCWGLDRGIKGAWVKGVRFLDVIEAFGSRWVEGISWSHWSPCYQGPSFCGGRKTQLSLRLCGSQIQKKKKKEISPLHLKIPVFTLCYVYKYSWKREMTCLCNIPSDLQSDAIAEPKTKARVIFLTNVNRRCTREFTVGHWNKMCGILVSVRWVSLRCVEKYWLVCQESSVIASWNCLVVLLSLINLCRFPQPPRSI